MFWRGSLDDQELTRQVNETIGRGLYLVELSTGARVRGTVREGVVRLDGEVVPGWPDGEVLGVMSFVPTEPLDDGWYVLVADLREWMAMGPPVPTRLEDENNPVEDDMMFVRIRIGSEPTWYVSGVSCSTRRQGDRETWCDAWAGLSEEVDALGTTRFELRIDGEAASDCVQPSGPGGWQCPHYPDGTAFEITLIESDVVVPLEGVVTQALTGGGMSSQRLLIAPRFGIDIARSAR